MARQIYCIIFACCLLLFAGCGGGGGTAASLSPVVPNPIASAALVSGTTLSALPTPAASQVEPPSGDNPIVDSAAGASISPPAPITEPVTNNVNGLRVQVVLTYKTPLLSSQSAIDHAQLASRSNAIRAPEYISPANTKFSVMVTPLGGTAAGPYNGSCSTASCTLAFSANVGANTIAVKLTDTPGTVLSTFTTTQIVQPTAINTFNFTANPVINSATVALASSMLNAGTAAGDAITVNGLDASGNIIVGSGNYVDASGSPVRLTLSLTNNTAGGRGIATLSGPQVIFGPVHPQISLQYDGNWLNTSTVTIAASKTLPGGLGSAVMTTNPRAIEYNVAIAADAVALGPDGNVWYSSFNDSALGKYRPGASYTNYSSGITGSGLLSVTPGPDGNMWFTEYFGPKVGRISTAGQITEFGGIPGGGSGMSIAAGSDGRMWVAVCASDCNGTGAFISAVNTNGVMQSVTTNGAAGNGPTCLALARDGNIWFGYQGANIISKISTGFVETDFPYTQPNGQAYSSCAVAPGSDGNIWFTDPSQWAMERVDINSGVVTVFSTGITGNAGINAMVNAPDNNMWFTEGNNGILAKITSTGTVKEYGSAYGIPGGISGIVVGPDGNLWFGDPTNKKIGKFVL